MLNYYEILEIPLTAEYDDICSAYKKKALKYHPDKNKNIDANFKMQQLNEAKRILANKESRKKYDNQISIFNKSIDKNFINQVNNEIDEILNLLNKIENIKIEENYLNNLKEYKENTEEKFNSLFNKLISINSLESAFFLKKISKIKLRDKVKDIEPFLSFQEKKFNCIKDNEFLEKIIKNHDLFKENQSRFNTIFAQFSVIKKTYNFEKQCINDFQNFKFTNLINEIDNFFEIKTELIKKIKNNEIKNNEIKNNLLKIKKLENQLEEIMNKINELKSNNNKIKIEIKNLQKQKINSFTNFLFIIFSFGCYNKNKILNKKINIKNNEIKNNLLKISKLDNQLEKIEDLLPQNDIDEYMNNFKKK